MFWKNKKELVQNEEKIPAIKVDCRGTITIKAVYYQDETYRVKVYYEMTMHSDDVGREIHTRSHFVDTTFKNEFLTYQYIESIIFNKNELDKKRMLAKLRIKLGERFLESLDNDSIKQLKERIGDGKMELEFTMEVEQDA